MATVVGLHPWQGRCLLDYLGPFCSMCLLVVHSSLFLQDILICDCWVHDRRITLKPNQAFITCVEDQA